MYSAVFVTEVFPSWPGRKNQSYSCGLHDPSAQQNRAQQNRAQRNRLEPLLTKAESEGSQHHAFLVDAAVCRTSARRTSARRTSDASKLEGSLMPPDDSPPSKTIDASQLGRSPTAILE